MDTPQSMHGDRNNQNIFIQRAQIMHLPPQYFILRGYALLCGAPAYFSIMFFILLVLYTL